MKNLKYTFTAIVFMVIFSVNAQTTISGDLTGPYGTSLPAGYYAVPVWGNAFIPTGATFTIEPGVIIDFEYNSSFSTQSGTNLIIMENTQFQMKSDSRFSIKGDLHVQGTPTAPASFYEHPANIGTSWLGIILDSCITDTVIINYADIRDTYKYGYGGIVNRAGAISVNNSSFDIFKIRNSHFSNNDVEEIGACLFFNLSNCTTSLIVENTTFDNNMAQNAGGAVYLNPNKTDVKFLHNIFSHNSSMNGGAVYVYNAQKCVMGFDRNEFVENVAEESGGSCFFTGWIRELVISRNNFKKNETVLYDGGAILFANLKHFNPVTIMLNTFEENIGRDGGAVCSKSDSGNDKNYFNNLFFHNEASDEGGAVYCEKGYSFVNNTITENSGTITTGGVYATTNIVGPYAFSNNIFWNNVPLEVNSVLSVGSTYPLFAYCDIDDAAFSGPATCTNSDPLFSDPATLNFRLQPASPCYNTGDPAFVPGFYYMFWNSDLDNTARVKSGTVDMGAFELFVKISIGSFKSSPAESSADEIEIGLYPNPASDFVNIKANVSEISRMSIGLFDMTGKSLLQTDEYELSAGANTISVDISSLPQGTYFVKIESDQKTIVKKVIVN
jgi:hypothetical protein